MCCAYITRMCLLYRENISTPTTSNGPPWISWWINVSLGYICWSSRHVEKFLYGFQCQYLCLSNRWICRLVVSSFWFQCPYCAVDLMHALSNRSYFLWYLIFAFGPACLMCSLTCYRWSSLVVECCSCCIIIHFEMSVVVFIIKHLSSYSVFHHLCCLCCLFW